MIKNGILKFSNFIRQSLELYVLSVAGSTLHLTRHVDHTGKLFFYSPLNDSYALLSPAKLNTGFQVTPTFYFMNFLHTFRKIFL